MTLPRPVVGALALLLMGASLALGVLAHQQKESITRVFFNSRTGNIEIMHRFLLHDAEHASRQLFGASADLLGNPADCERFETYVHERFALADQTRQRLTLEPVGYEIEGKFLWIYAQTPIPGSLSAVTLSHRALREVWPEQTNLVNIERDGTVRSALFSRGVDELTISLEATSTP